MPELINMGSLQLKFLHSKDDTGGSLDMFEMTLQPNARMPVPHHHESWDEIVFIKRGVVHGFTNRTPAPASCLCTLTPGVLGPSYFKEMAALLAGGAPD